MQIGESARGTDVRPIVDTAINEIFLPQLEYCGTEATKAVSRDVLLEEDWPLTAAGLRRIIEQRSIY